MAFPNLSCQLYQQHRRPPLQRTQGWGTLSCGRAGERRSKGRPPALEKEGDPVTWHGTGLWTIGLLVAALALWVLLRGRLRARQYHRIAEELGFTYQGRRLPETLDLSKASFGEPWDIATNVIAGTLKGIETIAFHFHANHGEVGYKQTTVAMKSSAPVVELSSLWQSSGICAERVGEWIVMFRSREAIAPSQIPHFLDDCRNLLQYFEDHLHQLSEQQSG